MPTGPVTAVPSPTPVATAGDPDLVEWVKAPRPWLQGPPPGMPYNCWRDPFVIEWPPLLQCCRGSGDSADSSAGEGTSRHAAGGARWRVAIGSGVDGAPGADGKPGPRARGVALVYSTAGGLDGSGGGELGGGWRLEPRPLCEARSGELDGRVWECPVVVALRPFGGGGNGGGRFSAVAGASAGKAAPAQPPLNDEAEVAAAATTPAVGAAGAGGGSEQQGAPQQQGPRGGGAVPPSTHLFSASAGRSPALGWLGRLEPGGGFVFWNPPGAAGGGDA